MHTEQFAQRHIGPRPDELGRMLGVLGLESIEELVDRTIPSTIRTKKRLLLPKALTEVEYLAHIRKLASRNRVYRSFIGMGYYGTQTPSVILRNILENPSWYTSYTPYQAEISQGRLEALLNFQTMVMDMTAMPIANASLLDESTAAAEAMIMMHNLRTREAQREGRNILFVDSDIFPQNLAVITHRAEPLGIKVVADRFDRYSPTGKEFGAIVQYPTARGSVVDYAPLANEIRAQGGMVTAITDLLALALITPPGEWGADIVVGSSQRFGVPMGFGGPHAAFLATRDEFKRSIPGRIIGVTADRHGDIALRMALQTREQHIKRERATSNICTAQALLATMAGMFAVYHGQEGIRRIAQNAHSAAVAIGVELEKLGYRQTVSHFFDTIEVELPVGISTEAIRRGALGRKINLNYKSNGLIGLSTDELTSPRDINDLLAVFAGAMGKPTPKLNKLGYSTTIPAELSRKSAYLSGKVFNSFRSETEMMRYVKKLERKDIALNHSMISLGSCTMKLNAATLMLPLSWPEITAIHPFAPSNQVQGYMNMIESLEKYLAEITGFDGVSLQPNSGASGEYTGLMVIRQYHTSQGQGHRNVVLIPASAHGTNPASAAMAGMQVVVVACDSKGNISMDDLRAKAQEHSANLSSFMVTYPSTHGVFEGHIKEMVDLVHSYGGQVYMDGANMNAQVGLTNPSIIGADVCHLNLHKTFAIPHGGGGPGVGPIAVARHLTPFLPSHPAVKVGGQNAIPAVASAPWGSASILPISYGYILMLGHDGLRAATEVSILNANYLAARLKGHFEVLYRGDNGFVGHEMILDCRHFKQTYNVEAADIARRLMDYGYHSPTLSFPVPQTLMVEPTESESLQELDRFVEALIAIKAELDEVKDGKADANDNVLRNAPHTAREIASGEWTHPYSREKAAFPLPWVAQNKFWPSVAKVDSGLGDRNLMCSCAPLEDYL